METWTDNELSLVARHAQSAPVDLTGMFDELGIEYREQPIASGQSGWIERYGDDYRVVINAREPEVRRRFTAAHELAHYLLHRDLMGSGGRMNRHTDRLFGATASDDDAPFKSVHEVQANRLAAQIIMPGALVRKKFAEGLRGTDLANAFRVSQSAMEIRLETLGLA